MAKPRLAVRSAKARDIAHRIALREKRSVRDVVERALEAYEASESSREPAHAFYKRLTEHYGTDIDLEAIVRKGRGSLDPFNASSRKPER
ncbi:plasmid stabilization protein [Chelativorans sp. M5D2P16]|uniref:plasmid stabilization protein n=1 Tax=Chelativorans sp. M5D2P16 TaxID=3095678 RepID=UPI002ACA48DE|nr:plasmid stabilization protein [Chelativorans sp. M5D2P16]MDZ5696180.1 plasmid stabilization protein [Chelativorans sp. M5D2P16]